MPVYHSDFDFAKAYQNQILREVELENFSNQASEPEIGLQDRLLLYLGESLINLGNKIMPANESNCIELSPEQAS